jgi:hypothetical protein
MSKGTGEQMDIKRETLLEAARVLQAELDAYQDSLPTIEEWSNEDESDNGVWVRVHRGHLARIQCLAEAIADIDRALYPNLNEVAK